MILDSAGSSGQRLDVKLAWKRRSASRRGLGGKERLTLLMDADDTLWENNIYFLEVTDEYLSALERFGVDRVVARAHLLETERCNIPRYGYGSRAFALTVEEAFRALAPMDDAETVVRLRTLSYAIFERDQLELRAGVCETLAVLARHHQLVLLTKGDREEQEWKVECSGLRPYFEHVEVVDEKNVHTYRSLIRSLKLNRSRTWMIGNSPRSDINPALAAGLNAVLVPHPDTWELELEEVLDAGDRLVIVESVSDLVSLFLPRQGSMERAS